jgi:Fe-S cluster assembly iron-binding protein IscA
VIALTERAAFALEEMLLARGAGANQGVKLMAVDATHLGMTIAEPEPSDQVLRITRNATLIIDPEIATALDGARIDCETTVEDGEAKTEFKLEAGDA